MYCNILSIMRKFLSLSAFAYIYILSADRKEFHVNVYVKRYYNFIEPKKFQLIIHNVIDIETLLEAIIRFWMLQSSTISPINLMPAIFSRDTLVDRPDRD